ncbi:MAG: type II and III secretion system protein family protein [Rhodomicrobium sp.]
MPQRSLNARKLALLASAKLGLAVAFAALPAGIGEQDLASAQSRIVEVTSFIRHIEVTRNKSRTFELARPFATAMVGEAEIADVMPISDRVLYLQGKKVGTTNVSVFDHEKRLIGILDVEVTVDERAIASKIHASTTSPGITVSSSHGQLILSGHAKNALDAEQAIAIAKAMAPDVPPINLIKVAPGQQVLLKVRFIEASRDAERDLGVNWFASNSKGTQGVNLGSGAPTQIGQSPSSTPGGLPIFQNAGTLAGSTAAPFAVGLANLVNKGTNIDVMISALETKGLARRLAEPDLVALSGDTASFIAGGEVPVPVVQPSSGATPTITVDYKPFGVQLTFAPTVLANGVINLRLTPSVSELDYTNAIQNQGFTIPALTKREARTTIELRDGQSFAIAGLLQTEGLRDVSQVPWLGAVPVLGTLFRSSGYQSHETDLIVIVTPHLVEPAAPGQKLATPLDGRLPSNDTDFFLLGKDEVTKQYTEFVSSGGGVSGPYGHLLPDGK